MTNQQQERTVTTPQLCFLAVNDIKIDDTYQRPLDEKRVHKLKKAFEQGACKAISVSRRSNGDLYGYDGQHTLALYKLMGLDFVPAIIVPGDQKKEAQWFTLMNGAGTTKATARQSHKAAVVGCDETAQTVQRMLDRYGVAVAAGGGRIGATSAIGSLRIWAKADAARLDRAMGFVSRLWANEEGAWSQIVLRAVWDVASVESMLDLIEKGARKNKVTPRRLLDTAAGMQASTGTTGGGSGYAKLALLQLCRVPS
jgi:hypothetical protein